MTPKEHAKEEIAAAGKLVEEVAGKPSK